MDRLTVSQQVLVIFQRGPNASKRKQKTAQFHYKILLELPNGRPRGYREWKLRYSCELQGQIILFLFQVRALKK